MSGQGEQLLGFDLIGYTQPGRRMCASSGDADVGAFQMNPQWFRARYPVVERFNCCPQLLIRHGAGYANDGDQKRGDTCFGRPPCVAANLPGIRGMQIIATSSMCVDIDESGHDEHVRGVNDGLLRSRWES